MEHQTGFNLNEALTNWRTRELETQPGVSADTARELESHLRDSVADLHGKGLSEEEAFWLAQRRLGSPEKLAAEITKADPARLWTERVFWMLGGVLSANVLTTVFLTPLSLVSVYWGPGALLFPAARVVLYIAMALFALAVARGRFPRILSFLSRSVSSGRRLAGIMSVFALIQFSPYLGTIWHSFTAMGVSRTSENYPLLAHLFSGVLCPVIVCYLLVHLRKKLRSGNAAKV